MKSKARGAHLETLKIQGPELVRTRRGTATDDQIEEIPTSSPMATDLEPSSPVGERGDRVTRLEEKLERLTAMVERLAEAQIRATTRTNPVNDLPRAPPVASTYGMDQGEPSIQEEPVRQRPGKEVVRDTPDTSNETNENTAWTANQAALPPLKVDMKTDLPTYDGVVDGDKLDGYGSIVLSHISTSTDMTTRDVWPSHDSN